MSFIQQKSLIVNCPICNSQLVIKNQINEQTIHCSNCKSSYSLKNDYLNLLPPIIRNEICKKGILARKIKDHLHITNLSKNDHDLIKGIIASKYMARRYFKNVVHPTEAAWSARAYERYEDLLITNHLDSLLKEKKVVFVDAGSGPGRYLILLGSKMMADSCKDLKKNLETARLYEFDKKYSDNLQYIIGIDYSEEMVSYSTKLLKKYGLGKLLNKKIFPMVGIAQHFHFNQQLLQNTHKVVVCTFQTLGNQENSDLQVEMLKSMKDLADPHGTIIVSVFNKKLFKDFGLQKFYGREVKGTVGEIINTKNDIENAVLRTSKGVYSKWFSKKDLESLLQKAGITRFTIMDEYTIKPISGFEEYLDIGEQKNEVFPRAIIAVAEI